jgi:16S rRNA G1207 methylase RsmC
MTDSKQKAIEFTKKNAKTNNIQNVEAKCAYLLRCVSGKYDKIISNPPTHMKLNELDELMKKTKELLKDKGEIYLVINNIVDYERVAKKYFNEIKITNQNEQYKIIKIKK